MPNPPKKSNGPPAKGNPAAKPLAAGKGPAAKPQPAGAKPPPAADKPAAKKPAPAKKTFADSSGRRKIGQVLLDLGLLDEDQLWEILDQVKTSGQRTGEIALARGLI